jgi:hypothetical protein
MSGRLKLDSQTPIETQVLAGSRVILSEHERGLYQQTAKAMASVVRTPALRENVRTSPLLPGRVWVSGYRFACRALEIVQLAPVRTRATLTIKLPTSRRSAWRHLAIAERPAVRAMATPR